MNRLILLAAAAMLLFASCAPRPYIASNMYQTISKHKTVAILAPRVNVQLRPRQMSKTSPAQLRKMEENTASSIQQAMYAWLLRKQDYMNYSVRFQDVTSTNAKLEKANIDYTKMRRMEPKELAAILGVDAVIDMDIHTDKPMSEGAAVTMQILFGAMGAGTTNHTQVLTSIHDGTTGDLLWKFTGDANGSAGSTPEQLIKMVMKKAARRFPYRRTQVDAAGHRRSSYASE